MTERNPKKWPVECDVFEKRSKNKNIKPAYRKVIHIYDRTSERPEFGTVIYETRSGSRNMIWMKTFLKWLDSRRTTCIEKGI